MNDLTCPKCQGQMRHYERNGVTVDQCTECRGIFLDRGELERLVDAESRWAEQTYTPPPAPQVPPSLPRAGDPRYDPRHDPRYSGKRKRKHWIEELFD